jgi:leucyl aminopeptidase (aminopeptidase T)
MTHHDEMVLTAKSLLKTDFAEQKEVCWKLGERLKDAKHIRVHAPGGTDIEFDLVEGRKVNVLTGQPEPGSWRRCRR